MTFLAPWLLLGLLATLIPPLLHLRRSRRQRRLAFSHTMFFDERFLRAARRARLQDRMLMVLRMLLLAALALALAQPMWGGRLALPTSGPRHVVLVLDDSASMAAGDGIARARAAALSVLEGLRPDRGDRVALVLAGRRAITNAPVPQPIDDVALVRDLVEQASATQLATDLVGALEAARAALAAAPSDARRQVYVFSDLPEQALPPDPLPATAAATETIFISTAETVTGDLAVSAVQTHASRPMVGVPFSFRVLVSNHGERPRAAEVALIVGGEPVAQRRVELPPRRDQFVRLVHTFRTPGWRAGYVRVVGTDAQPDALTANDQRHFAVRVADGLRVLATTSAPSQLPAQDELFFASAALTVAAGGASGMAFDRIPVADLAGRLEGDDRPGLLVLANVARLDDAQQAAVERFTDAGGGVLVTLGDRADVDAWNRLSDPGRMHGGLLPAKLTALPADAAALLPEERVSFADAAHPALAGLAEEPALRSMSVRPRFDAAPGPDAAVVLATGDGRPLLVEKPFGLGRIALLTTTLDRDATDLPVQPVFVPLLHRLAAHLAQGAGDTPRFALTGDGVDVPSTRTGEAWTLLGPDGQPQPALVDDAGVRFWPTPDAGVYQLRRTGSDGEPEALIACNVDHHEFGSATLDEPALAELIGPDRSWAFARADRPGAAVLRAGTGGVGLWDALLWAALAVAAVEPLVSRFIAKGREAAMGGTP